MITLLEIIEMVQKHGQEKDISIKDRTNHLAFLRYIYFKLAKEFTKYSTYRIGKNVKRNHATVLHGLKEVDLILKDPTYKKIYDHCKMDLVELMYKIECDVLHDQIKTYRTHFEKVKDQYYKLKSIAETC